MLLFLPPYPQRSSAGAVLKLCDAADVPAVQREGARHHEPRSAEHPWCFPCNIFDGSGRIIASVITPDIIIPVLKRRFGTKASPRRSASVLGCCSKYHALLSALSPAVSPAAVVQPPATQREPRLC